MDLVKQGRVPMEKKDQTLKRQIAALESQLDQFESELGNLDDILKKCGFPEGISTLKSTVEELIAETRRSDDQERA